MENSFLRNYYNVPRPNYYYDPPSSSPVPRSIPVSSPSPRSIPVHQQPRPNPSPSSKVVSIPIHFVASEKRCSVAAAHIQKVFRGFAVRKNVRKIAEIRSEVDEIETRILNSNELIRSDAKERLRVNEMLMSLLFRLDSIRGFDPAVKDCRKEVIRKVIALQDTVDAIGALTDEAEKKDEEAKETMDSAGSEIAAPSSCAAGDADDYSSLEKADSEQNSKNASGNDQIPPDQQPLEAAEKDSDNISAVFLPMADDRNPARNDTDGSNGCLKQQVPGHVEVIDDCKCGAESSGGRTESVENNGPASCLTNCEEEDGAVGREKLGGWVEEKEVGSREEPQIAMEVQESDCASEGGKRCESSGRTVAAAASGKMMRMMERLVAENGELKDLLMELCERNALQNSIINSLSRRVDALERAVARSDKVRQKKKRVEESCTERRKCGKNL